MDQKLMYTFRGWIAFVAFMDLGVAARSFIEKKCFLGEFSNKNSEELLELEDPTLPRLLGMYSILKAISLIHCTLFIHYKPIVSMGICTLCLSIYMYLAESLLYHSTTLNFYIVFPCVLNAITVVGLIIVPNMDANKNLLSNLEEDENIELIRQAAMFRRKKTQSNNREKKNKKTNVE
ncbi:hypothetical protein M8J76_010237 [Diaphorina citri]|nr:hypothetical protein M8J75_014361 [Diaphorina citri]KAI5737120.1 hypothetical protein M8J76_010237 [Diaphorina citri]